MSKRKNVLMKFVKQFSTFVVLLSVFLLLINHTKNNKQTEKEIFEEIQVHNFKQKEAMIPLEDMSLDSSKVGSDVINKKIDSYIDGDFNGWSGDTVYKLDNGQYWQQSEYDYDYEYEYHPKISIYETGGGFKMSVDGYDGEDMSVHQIFNVIESRINGEYKGWDGETTYSLTNGQVWQQSSYYYHYHYAYSPKVLIYNSTMHVVGDNDKGVKVMRLK